MDGLQRGQFPGLLSVPGAVPGCRWNWPAKNRDNLKGGRGREGCGRRVKKGGEAERREEWEGGRGGNSTDSWECALVRDSRSGIRWWRYP